MSPYLPSKDDEQDETRGYIDMTLIYVRARITFQERKDDDDDDASCFLLLLLFAVSSFRSSCVTHTRTLLRSHHLIILLK